MNSFDVLKTMSEENKDIRLSPHFVGAKSHKLGGLIEMGVEQKTLHDLMNDGGKYVVCLLIYNKVEYDEINKRNSL